MIIERILEDSKLPLFLDDIKKIFLSEGYNPTKKDLNTLYDFVRLNEDLCLNNPRTAFLEVFNNKDSLKYFEVDSFEEMHNEYGAVGKDNYFKIRLLEMEVFVKKYKLYLSHLGKKF